MSMSVVYATVNGCLVQENRGGVVTRHVADTLGSVIQTRDAAGNQTSSTTYWPFGEVRTQTGTNPSPWGFCGTLGYFKLDAAARGRAGGTPVTRFGQVNYHASMFGTHPLHLSILLDFIPWLVPSTTNALRRQQNTSPNKWSATELCAEALLLVKIVGAAIPMHAIKRLMKLKCSTAL